MSVSGRTPETSGSNNDYKQRSKQPPLEPTSSGIELPSQDWVESLAAYQASATNGGTPAILSLQRTIGNRRLANYRQANEASHQQSQTSSKQIQRAITVDGQLRINYSPPPTRSQRSREE
jgi:hypothetical protein